MIAPSLLSCDFRKISEEMKIIEDNGGDWIHLDIMDGHFVPNITFGAPVIKSIKNGSKLFFDVHLMLEKPEDYIQDFVEAGADLITVHLESQKHIHRTIALIKSYGIKAGIAINPGTSVCLIKEMLPFVDLVLVMSVNPGFGGQSFIPETLNKIKKLNKLRAETEEFNYKIEIDGGVNLDNAKLIKDLGCDVLVAGNSVFGASDVKEAFINLSSQVK